MTPTPLPEQGGDTTISDREAWLRIFEAIISKVKSIDYATASTNDVFDAMKKKLEQL